MCEECRVPLVRREGLAVELVQGLARPKAGLQPKSRPVMIDGDRVRRIGLQLHSMRTGACAGVNQALRAVEVLIVVSGQFRDDEGWIVGTNGSARDRQRARRGRRLQHNALQSGPDISRGLENASSCRSKINRLITKPTQPELGDPRTAYHDPSDSFEAPTGSRRCRFR